MRKPGILLLLIIILFFMTGCWDREEVNDIAIVTAAGVDKMNDGNVRLALQLALPRLMGPSGLGGSSGQGIEAKSTWVISETGETIIDAYRRIQMKLPRKVFFAHNRIIIIGEKVARKGLSPILDFFTRDRQSRISSYILFSKGEAIKILKYSPKFENIGSEVVREEEKLNIMVTKTLRDFLSMNLREGEEPVASQIEIIPSEVINNSDQDSHSQEKTNQNLSINGVAAFHKDKLVGWLNDKESRGLLWLRNEMTTSIISVKIPKEKGNGSISMRIDKSYTNITPLLQAGKLSIKMEVFAKGNINENTSKLDLNDPKTITYVQHKVEEDIQGRMSLSLAKVQKQFKSDVIGIGSAIRRTYPIYWEKELKNQWDQKFPNLKIKVTPHIKINHTGLNTKPFLWEDKEFQK